jgi:signal transduction histidine kinase
MMVRALKRLFSFGENTIRRDIRLFSLCLAALVVVTYSFLLVYYFFSGLEGASSYQLRVMATSYAEGLAKDPDIPRSFANIEMYFEYDELPEKVKEMFPASTIELGELESEIEETEENDNDILYLLLLSALTDGSDLFLVQTINLDEPDWLNVEPFLQEHLGLVVLLVGLSFLVVTYILVWILARKVVTPVQKLQNWADSLGDNPGSVQLPDFKYRELNTVAARLAMSIERISGFVEREATFLRHASHELRTPIAIISGNAALLARKEEQSADRVAVERIQRASHSMQQLVDTLLWLGRENDPAPELKAIDLAAVTDELIDELGYLIGSKSISVVKDLDHSSLELPEFPTKIVLSNMLRNAFQHTAAGTILITAREGSVRVLNVDTTLQDVGEEPAGELEHGIGLSLVSRIAQRLDWDFSIERTGNETRALLRFAPSEGSPR